MEVCKNKKSNRYFIYLKDPESVDNRALLITPDGNLKCLELSLFDDCEYFDDDNDELKNIITETQYESFKAYKINREKTMVGEIIPLKSNDKIFSFDEVSTKQGIIMKVLNLSGWDTFNIDEVTPEYSVMTQRFDFSLNHNGESKVFIEVKRVGEELDTRLWRC